MSPLVEQLRSLAGRTSNVDDHITLHLAADEITLLRERVGELERWADKSAIGAVLTGDELMDEMEAHVTARSGNMAVAKAIRDGFEGRGLPRHKGVLIHAVRNDLKVEAVTMFRRTAPKVLPTPPKEAGT